MVTVIGTTSDNSLHPVNSVFLSYQISTSQQYFSLTTNQHQPPATAQQIEWYRIHSSIVIWKCQNFPSMIFFSRLHIGCRVVFFSWRYSFFFWIKLMAVLSLPHSFHMHFISFHPLLLISTRTRSVHQWPPSSFTLVFRQCASATHTACHPLAPSDRAAAAPPTIPPSNAWLTCERLRERVN